MSKQVVVIMSLLLTLACGASGAVGSAQRFEISAANLVEWAGGIGSAMGRNEVVFTQEQDVRDTSGGAFALQRERGAFVQDAFADGPVGPATVTQNATVAGVQRQLGDLVGEPPMSRGRQGLTADLVTAVVKPAGIGTATGTHTFMASQAQELMTPFSTVSQSQTVQANQSAQIEGTLDNDSAVNNTLNLELDQQYQVQDQSAPIWVPFDP